METRISRHARQRLQQRGTRTRELMLVLVHGDIEIPAQRGCRFLRLSHRAVGELLSANRFTIQDVDRAKRLMVLVDSTGCVVTAFKCDLNRGFLGRRGSRR